MLGTRYDMLLDVRKKNLTKYVGGIDVNLDSR